MSKLPLSYHFMRPEPLAIRLETVRKDGLPDGVHTGGARVTPDDEVWKGLDGRPYANCEYHYPTQEAEALEALQEHPLYPKNWRVEVRHERRWLVRKKAYTLDDRTRLKPDHALWVEDAVRYANSKGWMINDYLTILFDPDTYLPFIADMSCAQYIGPDKMNHLDWEDDRVDRFFRDNGLEVLSKRRHAARSMWVNYSMAHPDLELSYLFCQEFKYIYASFYRPLSRLWATIPENAMLEYSERGNWQEGIPWTWIITKSPLPADRVRAYELEWVWSPFPVCNPHLPELE